METILAILVSGIAFFIGAKVLPGVSMKGFVQAIIVAVVVAVLNYFLGSFLKLISLGLLALLSVVLNAIIIMIADWILDGFKVKNFWWALALAVVVSIVTSIFGMVF